MSNTLQLLLAKDKHNPYLSIYKSEEEPDKLEVYFEMALLEKLNNGISSYHGKHLLGRLYNAGFKRKNLVEAFGFPISTLRRWGDALLTGDPEIIYRAFAGQGAIPKITPEIKRFIILKFNEIYPHNSYNYSSVIREEVKKIFETSLSAEAIRPLLNQEKIKLNPSFTIVPNTNQHTSTDEATLSLGAELEDALSKDDTIQKSSVTPEDHPKFIQIKDVPPVSSSNEFIPEYSNDNKANSCEFKENANTNLPNNRKLSLSKSSEGDLRVHHLGLILALYYIKTLEFDKTIVYQWLASILAGMVNIEQTASIDFNSLFFLLDQNCITSTRHQHTILTKIANEENANKIFAQNTRLLDLKNCKYFYFDPHSISYTGMRDILKGWCGSAGKISKVSYQDFFHDENGNPVYFKIFDNYFDMRERFKDTLIDDFREIILGDKEANPTFIIDRGIYGKDKMVAIANKRVGLVTWEKGYLKGDWDSNLAITKFIIQRPKNNSKDIKTWSIQFIKDETWNKIEGYHRLIVKIKPPQKGNIAPSECELSILSNGYISDLDAVKAMLNRWVQENDFKYMIEHFGLNEITSYKHDAYSAIQQIGNEKKWREDMQKLLIEKEVYSDEYKQHCKLLTKLNSKAKILSLKKAKNKNNKKYKFTDNDEKQLQQLVADIKQTEQLKSNASEKINKLSITIQKDCKVLNFEKKRYLDTIKILARNIFYKLIRIFRPIYDNYREDHQLLREITQASGVVSISKNRVVYKIDTSRNYTKKQKKAIEIFFDYINELFNSEKFSINGTSSKITLIK